MQQIRNSQSSSDNQIREDEILSQVLGTRRGHNKGRGRIVPVTSSSSTQSTGGSHKSYSQAQVDAMLAERDSQVAAMLAERDAQMQARMQALEERLNSMAPSQGFYEPPHQTPWNFASSSNFQNATNLESDRDDNINDDDDDDDDDDEDED